MLNCFYFAHERLKKKDEKIKITNDVDNYFFFLSDCQNVGHSSRSIRGVLASSSRLCDAC